MVGFQSGSLFQIEGDTISTNICLSANFPIEINIPVVLEGAPERASIVGGTNFNVPANTSCRVSGCSYLLCTMLRVFYAQMLTVMVLDNQIALEENITFSIVIQSSTPSFVVGGATEMNVLYMITTVTLQDDDGMSHHTFVCTL